MGEPAIEAGKYPLFISLLIYDNCTHYVVIVACHDMDQWGPPIAGQSFQLPIMGTVIQVLFHI